MASSVVIKTVPVTREKLARFLGNNQELIRLMENLVSDVTVNIPTATDQLQFVTEDSAAGLDLAQALANAALTLAKAATEGPPMPVVVLPDIPEDLTAKVAALEARLAVAERRISELTEGPTS